MEKLYCLSCDTTYRVNREDIRLMHTHGKGVAKASEGYRFEAGCFFKELAALKRSLVVKQK